MLILISAKLVASNWQRSRLMSHQLLRMQTRRSYGPDLAALYLQPVSLTTPVNCSHAIGEHGPVIAG